MAPPFTDSPHGYSPEIINGKPDAKFLCGYCRHVFRDPHQAVPCGHRFCLNCIDFMKSNANPCKCPSCETEGSEVYNLDEVFPDKGFSVRELGKVNVHCNNPGCSWTSVFRDYPKHLESCPYMNIRCERCAKQVPRNVMDKHLASSECTKDGVACPFDCQQPIPVNETEKHQREFIAVHLDQLRKKLHELSQEVHSNRPLLQSEIKRVKEKFRDLEMKLMSRDLQPTRETSLASSSKETAVYQGAGMEETSLKSSTDGGETNTKFLQLQDKKFELVEAVIAVIVGDINKMAGMIEEFKTERQNDQTRMESLNEKIRQLERTVAIREAAIAEQEKRIEQLELSTHDGVFIWRITEYARKRREAINNVTPSIYSPPFYASRRGYKMCCRLYLNGDGMGKGTHLSLFFVLLRSPYDALLSWPFNHRVTFTLLDQQGHDNLVDAFRPDPTSASFKRPTTDMNVASGCPMFVNIAQLEMKASNYLKEDTLFIKIEVDKEYLLQL